PVNSPCRLYWLLTRMERRYADSQNETVEEDVMQATVLYGAGDVRFEDRADPAIAKPTDAIIRLPITCICGSDLWPYRGIQPVASPAPMGHEYCGFVEEVGGGV